MSPITMSHRGDIVSRHLLRRRARLRAITLNAQHPSSGYRHTVRKAERGPWRWYVVKVQNAPAGWTPSYEYPSKPTRLRNPAA